MQGPGHGLWLQGTLRAPCARLADREPNSDALPAPLSTLQLSTLTHLTHLGLFADAYQLDNCEIPRSIAELGRLRALDLRSSSFRSTVVNEMPTCPQIESLILARMMVSISPRGRPVAGIAAMAHASVQRRLPDCAFGTARHPRRMRPLPSNQLVQIGSGVDLSGFTSLRHLCGPSSFHGNSPADELLRDLGRAGGLYRSYGPAVAEEDFAALRLPASLEHLELLVVEDAMGDGAV